MIKSVIKDFKLTAETEKEISCSLPCSIAAELCKNRIIPDPYYRDNIALMPKISCSWELSTSVILNSTVAAMRYVYIKISGVCAEAEFFFNGKSYGFMKNPNVEHVFNVTDGIKVGENSIAVKIISPLPKTRYLSTDEVSAAERLCDAGILGKCTLHASNNPIIDSVSINQRHEGGKVALDIHLETLSEDKDLRAVVTLVSPVGRLYFAGISNSNGTLIVPDPELWWPNGMGNPSLYKLTVTLYSHDEATDSKEMLIGLRDVKYDGGAFLINGKRVSVKGTSYVTDADVLKVPSYAEYEREIKSLSAASVNTLSVSALGVQPSEDFYRLCDKYGIIVLQKIPAPFAKHSVISSFSSSFKRELDSVLGKLSLHPSVCGVTLTAVCDADQRFESRLEIDEFIETSRRTAEPVAKAYSGFITLFEKTDGLIHGFISLPSVKTIETFAEGADMNLSSPVMELHTPSGRSADMLVNLHATMRYATSLEKLAYSSQIASAVHMKGCVEAARRNADNSMIVAAHYNDAWPSLSSSFVDFFGRRKALYYAAKKFYAPVAVSVKVVGSVLEWYAVNDTDEEYDGSINYALYDSVDKCIHESKHKLHIGAGERTLVFKEDFSKYTDYSLSRYYVIYDVFDGVRTTSKQTVLFAPMKAYSFTDPSLKYEISGSQRAYEIALSSSAYAGSVFIDFSDVDAEFSDNFIDVHPDYPVKLSFVTDKVTTAEHLRASIKLMSAFDIMN